MTARANDLVRQDYRQFSADDLAKWILAFRRSAIHRHYSPSEWRRLDHARRRYVKLIKEAA